MTHAAQHAKAVLDWEALFKAGRLSDLPTIDDKTMASLPDSTVDYLVTHVLAAGLELRLGPVIEGQYLIQIVGDDKVGFLASCPLCNSHSWGRPDFGDLDNNEALARLNHLAYGNDEKLAKTVFDAIDKAQHYESN